MKFKVRIFLILSVILVFSSSLSAQNDICIWRWKQIGKGAESAFNQVHLFDTTQSIAVLRYRMRNFRTELANDPGEEADSTSALIARHGGIAGINGSYFSGKRTPVTFTKDDGAVEGMTTAKETFRVDGVVAFRRGGRRVEIFPVQDTAMYESATGRYREALAAGPILLLNGKDARAGWPPTGFYQNRHPRSVIGTTEDGWVYLIVIDGRFPGQASGATISETVEIAKMFGLKDALNLDGGGSSTLWTQSLGVISHPSDNKSYDPYGQRRIPNVIYIR